MPDTPLGRLHYDGRGLPRGRSSLSPPDVQAAHRDRLTHAVIGVVAQQGYAATTVADVVAAARVSRAVFYGQFAGKEECFLAACFQGLGLMTTAIGRRVADAPADPPDEVLRATVAALLQFLVDEPAFARCFLIEMPLAGAEARRRFRGVVDLLADNTRRWHERVVGEEGAGRLHDASVYRMLAAGAAHECAGLLLADDAGSLSGLEEAVMHAHVATLLGRDPRRAQ